MPILVASFVSVGCVALPGTAPRAATTTTTAKPHVTTTTTRAPATTTTTTTTTTTATTAPIPHAVGATWALGDSQGAYSNDPARGLPWPSRLGIGNGADGMQGAGWTVPGPHSSQTIAQRAQALAAANTVKRFIVMAGVNDLGAGRTVTEMLAGVTALQTAAARVGAVVTYVGVVPFPAQSYVAYRNADRLAFNRALAARYGANFVDCSASMADAAGWMLSKYSLSPSDLHLNSAGEQALASCIAAAH